MPQERRSYSKPSRPRLSLRGPQSETSIANFTLTHDFNANFIHKFIQVRAQKTLALKTALVPVRHCYRYANALPSPRVRIFIFAHIVRHRKNCKNIQKLRRRL